MDKKSAVMSPEPALQFIFCTFGILTWLSVICKLPMDSALTLGIIEISLGIGAFAGSILLLEKGNIHGNVDLVLSVILGFSGGITQIVSATASYQGLTFHPWIGSVIILLGGIFVISILPTMMMLPVYEFLSHVFVALGFLCLSSGNLLHLYPLKLTGAWLLFLFAVTGMYYGISLIYLAKDKKIWQGPTMIDLMKK